MTAPKRLTPEALAAIEACADPVLLSPIHSLVAEVRAAWAERDEARQEDSRFPIQRGPSVLWSVMLPHEAQARLNHQQTLACLAERGGLCPIEALAVVEDRAYPWRATTEELDEHRARWRTLVERTDAARSQLLARAEAAEARIAVLEAERPELLAVARAAEELRKRELACDPCAVVSRMHLDTTLAALRAKIGEAT